MLETILSLFSFLIITQASAGELISPLADNPVSIERQDEVLASHILDLETRDEDDFINDVFKDNILLALQLFPSQARNTQGEQGIFSFSLQSAEVFAFHKNVLSEYQNKPVKTIKSEFSASEGYRSSGYLFGDGICHLASLINWTAVEVGLKTRAEVNHNFRSIPGVPREHGVSIRYRRGDSSSARQNLYVENNLDFPILFRFELEGDRLRLEIVK